MTVNSPQNIKPCEWKSKEKTWNIQTHQVVSWLLSFPRFRENPPVIIKLIFWLIKLTWEHKSSRRGGKAKNKKDDIDESFGWIIVKSDAKIANWEYFIFHFPFNRIRFSQNHLTRQSCLLFFRKWKQFTVLTRDVTLFSVRLLCCIGFLCTNCKHFNLMLVYVPSLGRKYLHRHDQEHK